MQILGNGILNGLIIALMALAFQLVYLPTKVFHVALGGIYVIAPYIAWVCLKGGLPWYLALPASLAFCALFAIAIDYFNHAPLARRHAPFVSHLIISLGVYIVSVQVLVMIWGSHPKEIRIAADSAYFFGDLIFTATQMWSAGVSIVVLSIFSIWLWRTDTGLQFRALADNPTEIAMRGYNITRLRMIAFGLSGAIAAIGALLVAREIGFHPHSGLDTFLLAVVAAIIGGQSSFIGPIIGGLLLGIVRSEVVWYMSAQWQDGITFVLLAVFLLLRPQGIVAKRARLEAEA